MNFNSNHERGNWRCPSCRDTGDAYPKTCACGGLIHGDRRRRSRPTEVEEQCDQCDRAFTEDDMSLLPK